MGPVALGLAAILAMAACSSGPSATPTAECPTRAPSAEEAPQILADVAGATVRTNQGEFRVELYGEAAPIATANFVALARCGFYDGITFHRVIPGFVIQAGDPQTRDNHDDFQGLGSGGPGYRFVIEPPAPALTYDLYVLAMANAGGTDTNGSQFFIDLADLNAQLARSYTIFGLVTGGTEVVDAIGQLPTSARDVPLDPAIIESIEIVTGTTNEASPER